MSAGGGGGMHLQHPTSSVSPVMHQYISGNSNSNSNSIDTGYSNGYHSSPVHVHPHQHQHYAAQSVPLSPQIQVPRFQSSFQLVAQQHAQAKGDGVGVGVGGDGYNPAISSNTSLSSDNFNSPLSQRDGDRGYPGNTIQAKGAFSPQHDPQYHHHQQHHQHQQHSSGYVSSSQPQQPQQQPQQQQYYHQQQYQQPHHPDRQQQQQQPPTSAGVTRSAYPVQYPSHSPASHSTQYAASGGGGGGVLDVTADAKFSGSGSGGGGYGIEAKNQYEQSWQQNQYAADHKGGSYDNHAYYGGAGSNGGGGSVGSGNGYPAYSQQYAAPVQHSSHQPQQQYHQQQPHTQQSGYAISHAYAPAPAHSAHTGSGGDYGNYSSPKNSSQSFQWDSSGGGSSSQHYSQEEPLDQDVELDRDVIEEEQQEVLYAAGLTDDDVEEIFRSARHGRVEEIESLLDRGIPVDVRDEHGNTLLTIACQNGNKRVAKVCLRRSADLNARNYKGNTPLHYCYHYGYGESLGQYLVDKGANAHARNKAGKEVYAGI